METINYQEVENIGEITVVDERTVVIELFRAAQDGCLETVRSTLDTFPHLVHAYYRTNGHTALHMAAREGHVEIVKCLIDQYKADVHARGTSGETPLTYAIYYGSTEIIGSLLDRNADIEARFWNCTPLQLAVYRHKHYLVKYLLERGANVEAARDNGDRALHIAASNGDMRIVKILLDQGGAELSPANNDGHTPLMKAAMKGKTFMALELMGRDPELSSYVQVGMSKEAYLDALTEAFDRGGSSTVPFQVQFGREIEE